MGRLVIPKTYVQDISAPLIFLAGPIKSAPIWQDEAVDFLLTQNPDLFVASPRFGIRDKIEKYIISGEKDYFSRARAWERHYLDIASKTGAILFWLPEEAEHSCQKPYAAMTRIELGQWMMNYKHDNSVRFCIGSEDKFPGLGPIKYDLSIDAPDKKIFSSLEETCTEAVRLACQK